MSRRQNLSTLKLAVALTASICAMLSMVQSAQATVTPITSGELSWGVHASFRGYILSSIAKGKIVATGGAQICNASTCDSDGVIEYDTPTVVDGWGVNDFVKFPVVSGSFDDTTNTLELTLGGSLQFLGHFTAGAWVLDTTFSDLRVSIKDGASVIRVDAVSVDRDSGTTETFSDVNIVELGIVGKTPTVTATDTTWAGIPTTMTEGGSPILGYPAGTALDPATIAYQGPGGFPLPPPEPDELDVTDNPDDVSRTVGSRTEIAEATFTADAEGTDPITVKWQKRKAGENWADVAGATSKSLTVQATSSDDATFYRAVFHNGSGDAPTTSAKLTVSIEDLIAPVVTLLSPTSGTTTTASSTLVTYTATDNDDPSPECTLPNGTSVPLKLGTNAISVTCVDENGGNSITATATVTRVEPAPEIPAPAAPSVKNGKTVKLKKGKAATVVNGTITCASTTTCVYTLPKSIKIKVGKKTYSLSVKGPSTLEPGQSQAIKVTLSKTVVNAIKKAKKTVKLDVKVEVSNTLKVRHETAKNSISNVR